MICCEASVFRMTHSFTARVNEKGNDVATADGVGDKKCVYAVQKGEIQILQDLTKPRVLQNEPSAFGSGKLGVTLKRLTEDYRIALVHYADLSMTSHRARSFRPGLAERAPEISGMSEVAHSKCSWNRSPQADLH